MGTSDAMLAAARASLGLRGRPNYITSEYAKRHGDVFLRSPWCDMSVTYWARHSGNTAAVLPGGDRAYTVWHAQDFMKIGRWHSGSKTNVSKAKPGDIVFFDWGNSDRIEAIDHIGIVEKNLGGGRLQTIEGNTGDACLRRVRSYTHIAGLGSPAYAAAKPGASAQEEDDMEPSTKFKISPYWKDRGEFSHETYDAGFLWAGAVSETRTYGKKILAQLGAQQATINKLVDLIATGGGLTQAAVDAFKAELREEIDGIVVRFDTEESA